MRENKRLTRMDRERYSRQIMISDLGEEGQEKLKNATVAVFGLGGLGSPATIYLAVAGVGKLILADYQKPELSNLNRQIQYWEQDVKLNKSKAVASAEKIEKINSDIVVQHKDLKVTADNIEYVFGEADLIVDCLDDFSPRYLLNGYCVENDIPFVHAAVEGLHGQITAIVPGKGPCLKCVFPTPPPRKDLFPILGATAGVFGVLEAVEAVKIITGMGEPLISRLLIGDLKYQEWEILDVSRVDECPVCCE